MTGRPPLDTSRPPGPEPGELGVDGGVGGTAHDLVALVPAAGRATRLGALPCSKEIVPVGARRDPDGTSRAVVAIHPLLEALHAARVERAFVILRHGKWDIPAFLGGRPELGPELAYLVVEPTRGVPFTLDAAHGFVRGARVALGLPDILFEPVDAFARLIDAFDATRSDAVLGLFPTDAPGRSDMVAHSDGGRVTGIVVKPDHTDLTMSWILALWGDTFSAFMHDYLQRWNGAGELHQGQVFQAAIDAGLILEGVTFDEGRFIDIGTPDGLERARTMRITSLPRGKR